MKKYSENFSNYKILDQSTIGFEFEFLMKDLSYYKTLELLNQYLSPVVVHGFTKYHSDFVPTDKAFKIEPDLSGKNLVEIITGPMEYQQAKYYLIKILKFISEYGYTNSKSSIHFNLSFKDKNLNDLNILKLILCTDEEEIYNSYPNRKNNIYAKSIKKIIPYKEYDFYNVPIDVVKNNLRLPSDKYFGINFLHINGPKESQRIEFRYIGGADYEKNPGQILYFLDKFIVDSYQSISGGFNDKEIDELEKYLKGNISNFKTFSKYDNFIVEFPSISLQVDQNNLYQIVSTYYDRLYPRLFTLIDSTNNLKDCIINWISASQMMEVVDGVVDLNLNVKDYHFVNSKIINGIFQDCIFENCEITDSQLLKSKIDGCDIKNSKVLSCTVESSTLDNCFFMNGYLNSEMNGGILRSVGKLGPYANISSETQLISDGDFFDIGEDGEEEKGIDKGKFGNLKNFKQ